MGDDSVIAHYKKLVRDFDDGLLPEDMADEINTHRRQLEYLNFKATYPFRNLYKWFFELRTTKAHESPINFTDIQAFQEVRRIELMNWMIEVIFRWDKIYYAETSKKDQ